MSSLQKDPLERFNETSEVLSRDIENLMKLLKEYKRLSRILFNTMKEDIIFLIGLAGDNPATRELLEKYDLM